MTNQEALDTLHKGLDVATQKGSFSLNDAIILGAALQTIRNYITTHQPEPQNSQELRNLAKKLQTAQINSGTEDTV